MKTKILFIFLMTLVVLVGGTFVYIDAFNAAKDDLTRNSGEMGNVIIVPSNQQTGAAFKQSKRKIAVTTDNSITPQIAGAELSQNNAAGSGIYSASRGGNAGMFSNRKEDIQLVSSGGSGSNMLIAARSRSGGASSSGGSSGGSISQGINSSAGGGTILAPFGAPSPELNRPTGQPPVTLPPPEGTPVGEGLWILMLLGIGYLFYIRRK